MTYSQAAHSLAPEVVPERSLRILNSTTLIDRPPGKHKFVQFAPEASAKTVERLKLLGIISGVEMEIVSKGNPLVIRVGQTRVGLPHSIAREIIVEDLHEST